MSHEEEKNLFLLSLKVSLNNLPTIYFQIATKYPKLPVWYEIIPLSISTDKLDIGEMTAMSSRDLGDKSSG